MKKKSALEKLTPIVLGTCMLTLVASCGNDDDDSNSSSQQQQQEQEGTFTGALTPVNSQIVDGGTTGTTTGTTTGDTGTTTGTTTGDTGTTTGDTGTTTGDTGTTTGAMNPFAAVGGTVTVTRVADEFRAMVDATEATAAIHPQFIYAGSRCPTTADDTNGDGYVDAAELIAVTGQAIVPLDSDLKSQSAGGVFPSGSNYSYDESTSYAAMYADLQLPDTNTNDFIGKLAVGEELSLGTRVVVVHGVPASTTLPPTVVGAAGLSPQQALPIACTVLSFSGSGSSSTTGTTTGDTGSTTGTTTGDTGSTTGTTGTTTGDAGTTTGTTTGTTGTTTGTTTGM